MTDQLRLGTLGDEILAGPSEASAIQGDGMTVPIPFGTGATIPIPLYGTGGDLEILGGITIPTP